jgi:hypothetical protein
LRTAHSGCAPTPARLAANRIRNGRWLFGIAGALALAGQAAAGAQEPLRIDPDGWTSFAGVLSDLGTSPADSVVALRRGGGEPHPCHTPVPESALALGVWPTAVPTAGWRPGRWPAPLLPWRPWQPEGGRFRWRVAAAARVDLPERFALHSELALDSDPALDPGARVREYRQLDASVEVPIAMLAYRGDRFAAAVGRGWLSWGPGWTGSLILDDDHPPGDGLSLTYAGSRWSAAYRLEEIDARAGATADGPARWRRYVAAHRLDLAFGAWRFGLTETALVAADGAPPLWAFNPLLPWLLSQQEDRDGTAEQANVNWALDLVWNPGGAWSLYGQLLVDDVMIDPSDRETYPDQLGYLAGLTGRLAELGAAAAPLTWGVEYTRIDDWTYVNRRPELQYAAWDAPLGHPAGPGSETVSGFLRLGTGGSLSECMLWGRWYEHGRTYVGTTESPVGQAELPLPAPPVVRWLQFGLAARVATRGWGEFDLRCGWTGVHGARPADAASEPSPVPPWPPDDAAGGVWAGLAWTVTLGPWWIAL